VSGVLRRVLSSRTGVAGAAVVILLLLAAALGPMLAPYNPIEVNLAARLTPPLAAHEGGPAHWLGTDQLGRDILSRILHASRVTVSVALTAVALTAAIGVGLGLISGYFGGLMDNVLMRVVDVQLAFPTILLAITMVAVLGRGLTILILVFVIAEWVRYVRVIRAQVLVVRETQYVEAARAIGARDSRILGGHIFRNVLTDIIILVNLEIGRIILLESSLSYLGLGVQPPMPTWGNMVNEGRLYLQTSWWVVTFPGLAIVTSVLGLNLFGEGLRGAYDPTGRE
jgi:peptide/nickel transport system permease protein